MAFYLKYRPKSFADLVGEEHIRKTLIEAVKSKSLSHAYLLCGPRGTGKTSTARLLAKAFNCEILNKEEKNSGEPCNGCDSCMEIAEGRAIDVIEIDAASHTKVDEIREVIDKAQFAPVKAKKKVYIIDEVHMLSNSSFNALLKTLEEPPSHVVFILATTEVHKLPATILSRTQRYDFHRVLKEDLIENLKKIALSEKITIDDDSLDIIASSAEGGHRDAIGLLEQVASATKKITRRETEKILGITGKEEVFLFLGAIFNTNPEEGLKIAHRVFAGGGNMSQFCKDTIEILRKTLLFQAIKETMFEETKENTDKIIKLSSQVSIAKIISTIESFMKASSLLKDMAYPILPIEMAIVESCSSKYNSTTSEKEPFDSAHGKPAISSRQSAVGGRQEAVGGNQQAASEQAAGSKQQAESSTKQEIEDNPQTADSLQPADEVMTVPVEVLEMTEDLWPKVIEAVNKENSTLAALLRDAKPIEINGGKIKLGVKFAFHKDKISEQKNCAILEGILTDKLGVKSVVSCEILKPKPIKKSEGKTEDLGKAAEEIFG